jgi:excisionase family DNA binding protein
MQANEQLLSLVADGLASIPEAADFLGISRGKLYSMMDKGEIKFCKLGKSRRVPWAALKKLAAEAVVGED